ncbi:MAG: acetyl-CoA synthetase [Dehalococcoidia bacterium]|nr:acetyl-CoA synthetase [Dehalococcoidia bacterium]
MKGAYMGLELDYIFHPKSIAVAGASASPDKQGHTYFKNLLEEFRGKVYPINFRVDEILGVRTYKSVRDLPENVDYVISAIPNRDILDLVDACASKGVRTLHLFTARFSETGYAQETKLEQELLRRARASHMRIIGPNGMGLYYPKEGISFGRGSPKEPGKVGILSQSGGNASEIVSTGTGRGLRFSKVVSYGNALDINEADLMEYLADDPETEVIGGYIEGVRDGPRFVKALRHAAQRKPVVLLKGGRTGAGTSMVSSHTASLAGSREVWEAMCRQTGAVNTSSLEELVDMLVAFNFMPQAKGLRVLVGGGAGGRSVLSADECEEEGLQLLPIPPDVRAELTRLDPFFGPWVTNPVDGSIMGGSSLKADEVLELIARSPSYDMVINNIGAGGPGAGDDPRGQQRALSMIGHTQEIATKVGKPVALVMADVAPGNERQLQTTQELRQRCIEAGFAIFPSIGRASRAVRRLVDYYRHRDGVEDGPGSR